LFKKIVVQLAISITVLFLALLYSSTSFSKEASIRFEHLTIEDGLPQNSVLTMLQDSAGFMWFGTEVGLARYDGYHLKVFKHDANNSNSLSHNYITKIVEDSQGNLWIGTRRGGLNYFNTKTEQFTHYRHQENNSNSLSHDFIYTIVEDNQENLWIGTVGGGLNYFNTKTEQFTHYRHQENDPTSLSHDNVLSIIEDSKDNLWIGTANGLNYYNIKNAQFTPYYHQPNDLNSISHNNVFSVIEDSKDNLWIGTRGGLNHFNTKDGRFTHYRHKENNPNSLSKGSVYSVIEDSQGNIWAGTGGGGLNYFNTKTEQFTQHRYQSNNPNSLSNNNVFRIVEDDQSNIWIGTLGGGLNHFNIKNESFTHYSHQTNNLNSLSNNNVFSIVEDSQGDIWVGTLAGGLNHYNSKNKQVTHYRHQANNVNSLSDDIVSSVIEGRHGNIWIGTNKGVNHFNIKNKQFTHYRHQDDDSNSLSNDIVMSMIEDSKGNIWIGTNEGINHFNTTNKKFTHYRHQNDDPYSLSNNIVLSMIEDSQGNLWFGTTKGLNHFNTKTEQFTHYRHQDNDSDSLSNDAVLSITEDSHGNIWVGTYSGLNMFDTKSKKFKIYNKDHGLPDNVIYSTEEDKQGYIWISTNQGLSRMDPKAETFKSFNVSDGLQSNEFNIGASFKSKTGELFFGGINGLNRFFPENSKDDIQPPKVVITKMLLLNKSVPIALPAFQTTDSQLTDSQTNEKTTGFNLAKTIHETKSIILSHQDNIITFEFSVLHFRNTKKNKFSYQLVGWDKDWVHTDYKNRRATYTNLPHGDYTFSVKASNSDGYWSEEGASLQITVLPPPWKTWWAYTLYGLALLIIIYAFIRSQRDKLIFERKLNSQLESKVEERTKEKQHFIENISHELKTPLTLIFNALETVSSAELSIENNKKINNIKHNGQRLFHLVEQLLSLANNEQSTEKKSIVPLAQLCKQVINNFSTLASTRVLTFTLDCKTNAELIIEVQVLETILNNLVSNAIKYADSSSEIKITCMVKKPFCIIKVTNMGTNIPTEYEDAIFEKFYRLEHHHKAEGQGIGLSSSRELVESYQGTLTLDNSQLNAVQFIVSLPIDLIFNIDQTLVENEIAANLQINTIPNQSNKRLLIVEDNLEINQFLTQLLASNYDVLNTYNGQEAAEQLDDFQPDLILSDVMMPQMNGFELCQYIRQSDKPYNKLPIILLTAKSDIESQKQGLQAGATDYLIKPFSGEILKLKIANLLDSSSDSRSNITTSASSHLQIALSEDDTHNRFIERIRGLLKIHFPDPEFNVKKLSELMAMDERTLRRKSELYLSQKPKDIIREYRLQCGYEMLKSDDSILNISIYCGFATLPHFSKCFKDKFQETPKQVQRKILIMSNK
jgi:ligand-binding sensor domain-containing protein/signal transduction histidine kinase/DNA-binding response OmpR family regulator